MEVISESRGEEENNIGEGHVRQNVQRHDQIEK